MMGIIEGIREKINALIDEGMRQGYYSLHQLILLKYFLRLFSIIMLVAIPIILFYRMCENGFFGLCTNTKFGIALEAGYFGAILWIIFLIAKPVLIKKSQGKKK